MPSEKKAVSHVQVAPALGRQLQMTTALHNVDHVPVICQVRYRQGHKAMQTNPEFWNYDKMLHDILTQQTQATILQ